MPDRRRHRGPHPQDEELFGQAHHERLRTAVAELSWLLSRGYAQPSSLKLVGDRHDLVARQRMAVQRSSCTDAALDRRRSAEVAQVGERVGVDGFNALITVESALSGGVVLIGRDGSYRDLASIHGTYRKVQETAAAVRLVADALSASGARHVDWFLDRPVSNSGLLRGLLQDVLAPRAEQHVIELVDNPDPVLADYDGAVVSSDSWILDHCERWSNAVGAAISAAVPEAWLVRLG